MADTNSPGRIPVCILFLITLISVSMSPIVTGSSGLAWAGAVQSEFGHGSAVSYSPNGDIVASAHESTITIFDPISLETIQVFYVDFLVQSIAFTSDAHFLLVGMESTLPNTPATVVFEFIDGEYQRSMHTEDGKNIDKISVSNDDSTFATSSENGDIVEWKINNGTGSILDVDRRYTSPHAGQISCLDHSTDGLHLLSGGADGAVILWNRFDQTEINRWESTHPITDCSFSNGGGIMSWIGGGSLYLRNHDSTQSYFGQYDISLNASQISFTENDNEIAILSSDVVLPDFRRIDFVDIMSMPIVTSRTLYFGHVAVMMALHPNSHTVAISTMTKLVTLYSTSTYTETEIPTAIDTDQDNIPDITDSDDDGDGILDAYDNICIAGTNCHLQPDQNFIRQFDISINGNDLVIVEKIHLDALDSYHLRILAASSQNTNHRVDTDEFAQMQYSICSEFDENEVKTRWATHLEIEGNEFVPRTVQCMLESSDLYGTMDSDSGTRITVSWKIEGQIVNSVKAPYNVSILSGMQTPSSSIAHNVHTFPIHLEIEDVGGARIEYEVWNRRDPDLYILVDTPPVEEPNSFESFIDLMVTYWYFTAFILMFSITTISLGVTRYRNTVDFSELEDEVIEEQSHDEDWEKLVDEAAAWDEEMENDLSPKKRPKPPAAVVKDLRRKPKPPGAVKRDIEKQNRETSDVPVQTAKTKKTRKTEAISSTEDDESIDFQHLIETTGNTNDTDLEEDDAISDAIAYITSDKSEKSKRRRPVKRKKSKD